MLKGDCTAKAVHIHTKHSGEYNLVFNDNKVLYNYVYNITNPWIFFPMIDNIRYHTPVHVILNIIKYSVFLPAEYVNDVCNLKYYKNDDTQYTRIIRSHKYYPSRRPKSNGMCETEIPIARRSSLILDVTDTTDGHIPQGLHILSISRTTASKKVVDFRQMQVLHGNETKAMKVIADFRWKRRYLKGFMLSYSG